MERRPLELVGVPASPYSRKLRSVLRYRRIPHVWILRNSRDDVDVPDVPVQLMPVLVFPGEAGEPDSAAVDSTPLIRGLERDVPGRSVRPPDPALALIDALLEDYGDEWLTKAMFHYRWAFAADATKAASVLPRMARVDASDERVAPLSAAFRERQVGRLGVVGSTPETAPLIEASYERFLQLFDAHLAGSPYLLGRRPAACDFACFGQLTQLAGFDPTAVALTLSRSPRTTAWVEIVEDLSGAEVSDADWFARDALPDTLRALLGEVGRVYVPFLLANAAAVASGAGEVACAIDGVAWRQKPFPYQAKCLGWLRDEHAALSAADRSAVAELLAGTGCEALFA